MEVDDEVLGELRRPTALSSRIAICDRLTSVV